MSTEANESEGRHRQPDNATDQSTETPLVDPVSHLFDQTNGLADVEGDSDETAESDTKSAAERDGDKPASGAIPPLGGTLGQH
ncbi:hypothetical protein [Arthrobacter sp. efr-133-TYG-104]|uniref:hypothetical protein n=1 Tax=Arthrobacter sp. efr-133-TYG-104 TaxID=3040324 RepID=UPI00254E1B5F|nr:hypothetical protein [Arthrobacter sp. efr-133-TYG-104]